MCKFIPFVVDHCVPNPCRNHGLCLRDKTSRYRCHCQNGFLGRNCQGNLTLGWLLVTTARKQIRKDSCQDVVLLPPPLPVITYPHSLLVIFDGFLKENIKISVKEIDK